MKNVRHRHRDRHTQCRRQHFATTIDMSSPWIVVILLWQKQIIASSGFSSSMFTLPVLARRNERRGQHYSRLLDGSSISTDDSRGPDRHTILPGSLVGSQLHKYVLNEHKPLGCSVEESLANEPNDAKYVFVAEVIKGGHAARAGLREGDVIVQLSGTFDEVVDVAGLGIDKVRSLVGSRPKDNPLIIHIARGSDVIDRHQLALAELCIVGDDAQTAECIAAIYSVDNEMPMDDNGIDTVVCAEDDETECMLDSIWETWTEGLSSLTEEDDNNSDSLEEENVKKKIAPWSSRSSPSGTYVRDPKTGKLVNIDE